MYRGEIGALQFAHLPRRASHERIGMFWYHLIGAWHFGQCDGGRAIDSPRGTRQMTTLRKEAMHAPSPKLKTPRMTTSPSMTIGAEPPAPAASARSEVANII